MRIFFPGADIQMETRLGRKVTFDFWERLDAFYLTFEYLQNEIIYANVNKV